MLFKKVSLKSKKAKSSADAELFAFKNTLLHFAVKNMF